MRNVNFEYYLLDRNDQPKKPLKISKSNRLNNVISGNLSYSSLGRLKSSLEVNIVDLEGSLIDYMNDRLKVIVNIDDTPYNLGVFLICSPNKQIDSNYTRRKLTCYSKLKILDNDKVTSNYYLPANANVINAVIRLIGNNPYKIESSDKTTSTEREWKVGTPKLDIINDLLDVINYQSLVVDQEGNFITKPYISPENREIEIRYLEGEDSIISPKMVEDFDFFDIPNIFVRCTNDVNITPPLIARYPIQSGSDPITLDGRLPNVDVQEVTDVSDVETLYDICKRDAVSVRSAYSHLEFNTEINPKHGYLNCIEVNCMGIHDKYIETSWSFDLAAGALMSHTARKVVNLDGN